MTEPKQVFLTVLVPCFNEAATIAHVVKSVRESGFTESMEIIVIDDGSSDNTVSIIQDQLLDQIDTLIKLEKNHGKGYAIRQGIAAAKGQYTVIQDADLEYDPRDLQKLCLPVIEGHADVVFGSRFAGGETHRVLYFWHSKANRLLTLLSNIFTNLNLTDMETGYKLFRTDLLRSLSLTENRFGIEPELTAKIARLKDIRIYETGISYFGRTYAQGKKIGWRDAVRAVWVILKYGIFR
jgi:glycosyltransferase involved in cell wall biosynthesis